MSRVSWKRVGESVELHKIKIITVHDKSWLHYYEYGVESWYDDCEGDTMPSEWGFCLQMEPISESLRSLLKAAGMREDDSYKGDLDEFIEIVKRDTNYDR